MNQVINIHDARYSHHEDYRQVEETENLPAAFPVASPSCFYGLAGRFALDACRKSEADPMAVLLTFLTWAGAHFGQQAALQTGGLKHPPRLYCVLVGRSAKARKGTSVSPVKALIEATNILLAKNGKLPVQYADGPMSSGEGLAFAVRDPSEATDKGTGEASDPGVTDKRLMVIEQEFGGVLRVAKREGNSLTAAIRTFWDCGGFSPLTKHNRVTATNAHVCFVGHVTVGELLKHLNDVEVSNGFANRILWACIRRSKIEPFPERIADSLMQDYANDFAQSVHFGSLTQSLTFSPESKILWGTVYPRLSAERDGMAGEIASRAEAQVLRLATILSLLDCMDVIQVVHLQAALAIWDYCESSISYIFDSEENEDEQKILTALKKHGGLTTTEISVSVFARNMKSKQLSTLLKNLESRDRIRRTTKPPGGGKGKPATMWEITITTDR